MHRIVTLVSIVIAFASVMAFARGNPATAQDDMASSPFVGTWTWENGESVDSLPSIAHFLPDGAYIEVMPWGAVLMGVWEPTGDRAAVVTQVINYLDDDGNLVQGQGRGAMEIDERIGAALRDVTPNEAERNIERIISEGRERDDAARRSA